MQKSTRFFRPELGDWHETQTILFNSGFIQLVLNTSFLVMPLANVGHTADLRSCNWAHKHNLWQQKLYVMYTLYRQVDWRLDWDIDETSTEDSNIDWIVNTAYLSR